MVRLSSTFHSPSCTSQDPCESNQRRYFIVYNMYMYMYMTLNSIMLPTSIVWQATRTCTYRTDPWILDLALLPIQSNQANSLPKLFPLQGPSTCIMHMVIILDAEITFAFPSRRSRRLQLEHRPLLLSWISRPQVRDGNSLCTSSVCTCT